MIRPLVLIGVVSLVASVGCGMTDAERKVFDLRMDEVATIGSEAKTPGPRSAAEIAAIDSQVKKVTAYFGSFKK